MQFSWSNHEIISWRLDLFRKLYNNDESRPPFVCWRHARFKLLMFTSDRFRVSKVIIWYQELRNNQTCLIKNGISNSFKRRVQYSYCNLHNLYAANVIILIIILSTMKVNMNHSKWYCLEKYDYIGLAIYI